MHLSTFRSQMKDVGRVLYMVRELKIGVGRMVCLYRSDNHLKEYAKNFLTPRGESGSG